MVVLRRETHGAVQCYGVVWKCSKPESCLRGCFRVLDQVEAMKWQLSGTSIECSDPRVWPYFVRHPNHIFQQDNARPDTARLWRNFIRQNLPPRRCLGLLLTRFQCNRAPVEQKSKTYFSVQPRLTNATELTAAFQRICKRITRASINRLIQCMNKRSRARIQIPRDHKLLEWDKFVRLWHECNENSTITTQCVVLYLKHIPTILHES